RGRFLPILVIALHARLQSSPLGDQPDQAYGLDHAGDVVYGHNPIDQVEPQAGDPFLVPEGRAQRRDLAGTVKAPNLYHTTDLAHRSVLSSTTHPWSHTAPGTHRPEL